jgi:predicted DNA-binding protein with PD1-like motif
MKSKKIDDTYVIRLEKDEEIITALTKFCEENKIYSGSITGIGGAGDVTLKYFNLKQNKYIEKRFDEGCNYEIIALNGNISMLDGKPFVHLHVTLGDPEYKVFGGHLGSANISITAEIYINVIGEPIDRKLDNEFGLNFLDL